MRAPQPMPAAETQAMLLVEPSHKVAAKVDRSQIDVHAAEYAVERLLEG